MEVYRKCLEGIRWERRERMNGGIMRRGGGAGLLGTLGQNH